MYEEGSLPACPPGEGGIRTLAAAATGPGPNTLPPIPIDPPFPGPGTSGSRMNLGL
jgi:hypothetical protein